MTAPFDSRAHLAAAFREGLSEAGFVDRRNVVIEYRWGQDQFDRVPALVAELVQRQVAVLATPRSATAALAAKAPTTTIPTVLSVGSAPLNLPLHPRPATRTPRPPPTPPPHPHD